MVQKHRQCKVILISQLPILLTTSFLSVFCTSSHRLHIQIIIYIFSFFLFTQMVTPCTLFCTLLLSHNYILEIIPYQNIKSLVLFLQLHSIPCYKSSTNHFLLFSIICCYIQCLISSFITYLILHMCNSIGMSVYIIPSRGILGSKCTHEYLHA